MTKCAALTWQDGWPFCGQFEDVYFSRENGLEETRYVFLEQNQLPQRFTELGDDQVFSIGETGFGTGLNFLSAWQAFMQHAPASANLSFVSVEKFPLSLSDLKQVLALWPELTREAQALCAQYCVPPAGWHRFVFEDGRVSLTLMIGDAAQCWSQADGKMDAWFLDGFSPAKNPEMWSDALFRAMAQHASPGCTFATFTSAGFVRRGLQAAGFRVEKHPGFGAKRELSRGVFDQLPHSEPWRAPWYARPPQAAYPTRNAVVIGGGLAGTASAYSLANRGWHVTLIERHAALAQEGSGNLQGVLYARLSPHDSPLNQMVLTGYRYSLGLINRLLPTEAQGWHPCGVLQLPVDQQDQLRQQALIDSQLADGWVSWLDQQAASAQAGVTLESGGLFFPHGGWLGPKSLAMALCQHPNIQIKTNTTALELAYDQGHRSWVVSDDHNAPVAVGSVVVLAGAADSAQFDSTSHLPLQRVRGQVSYLPATEASQTLRSVLCHEGYITPADHGQHTLGASFRYQDEHLDLSDEEHQGNLKMLQDMAPMLYGALQGHTLSLQQLNGRAAFRCTSPDYLPLIGPVMTLKDMVRAYASLALDASLKLTTPAPWVPGLYVNSGHGSRGLVTAPLSGEILAAYINNEPAPLPQHLMDAVNPNRFVLRNLSRGRINPDEYNED